MDTTSQQQGGTRTHAGPFLNQQQFAELRRYRTDNFRNNPIASDAALATMLVGQAGWSADQTGAFLSVPAEWVNNCVQTYRERGIASLAGISREPRP